MKLNLAEAVTILLVAAAVLVGIQLSLSTINVSTLPTSLQPVLKYLVYIFDGGASIVIFTFVRNCLGYVENNFQGTSAGTAISYEANQLGATIARFSVYVTSIQTLIITLFAGTPYVAYAGLIAGAIGTVFDMVLKSLNDLGDALKTPTTTTTPTTTPTPTPTAAPKT
jgi:hypothetical protein